MIEQPLLFGPCAKRRTQAILVTLKGATYVGENVCLNPQPVCPREPGDGYEKCKTICQQVGHAEEQAVLAAGADAEGATITVSHTYGCGNCMALCNAAGVAKVDFVGAPD